MAMFGSLLGALSAALPGYVQGERMARQDNWDDVLKYNQAQQGQLANAFTEATWDDRIRMFNNQRYNSDFNTIGNFNDLLYKQLITPYNLTQASTWSANAQPLIQAQMQGIMNAWNSPMMNMFGNQAALLGLGNLMNRQQIAGGTGTMPSSLWGI